MQVFQLQLSLIVMMFTSALKQNNKDSIKSKRNFDQAFFVHLSIV